MKKNLSLFLIMLFSFTLLFGCTNYRLKPLSEMKYIEWKSENPDICFRTLDGYGDGYGYITVDGTKIEAYFEIYTITSGSLTIYPLDENGFIDYRIYAAYGIDYRNGKLIMQNVIVDLFEVEFGEVEFEKNEVDKSTIEAWEYTYIEWKSETLNFHIYQLTRYGHGTAIVEEVEQEITFLWGLNKDFKIFEGEVDTFDSTPIAEGTYTNIQTALVLTFTHDEFFNLDHPELLLNGITSSQR